jgi:RNA polymerase sigma-54 factor
MTSHRLQEAFDVLRLSRIDLHKLITAELQENPALELEESPVAESPTAERKQNPSSLVPDVRVERSGHVYTVVLTDAGRRLRVSPLYERVAGNKVRIDNYDDYPFFIEKVRAAKWFISAVEQRQSTILKVTQSICKFQRALLHRGLNYIQPMRLRDVAEDIRLHESTVNSAAANKWLETPHAIFALDWFFSDSRPSAANKSVL